jgi:hypothetical protein
MRRRFQFKVRTLILVAAMTGASIPTLITYYEHLRVIPRPEPDPLAGAISAPMNGGAPSTLEPSQAIREALRSESPLATFISKSAMPAFAHGADARIIEQLLADDFKAIDTTRWWATRHFDCGYFGEWRCNLALCTFYRPFVIEGERKYRVSGHFVLDPSGRWRANFERLVRLMTRDQFASRGKEVQSDHVAIEFIPSPNEARKALVDWLEREASGGFSNKYVHSWLVELFKSRNSPRSVAEGVFYSRQGCYEIDGWRLCLDDLSFERPIPLQAGSSESPVNLGGNFVLEAGRGWVARPSYVQEWDTWSWCEDADAMSPSSGLWHFPPSIARRDRMDTKKGDTGKGSDTERGERGHNEYRQLSEVGTRKGDITNIDNCRRSGDCLGTGKHSY